MGMKRKCFLGQPCPHVFVKVSGVVCVLNVSPNDYKAQYRLCHIILLGTTKFDMFHDGLLR